jgi:segregation and condensation protein B
MSESDPNPPDPPQPEIDPAILADVEGDLAAPPAAPLSGDVPELPGVPLATRVEAALFVATEPLPLKRLKELTRVEDGRAVREAIDALTAAYAQTGRAMRVEEVAGGFQLRTRPELAPMVGRVGRKAESEKLSPAALETLAIVAYRQPVLRADIERIRGVASGEVLRALVERGLVRNAGRAELPGSPLYYATTNRFLEVFGLRDLADLPRDADALRQQQA